MFAGSGNNLLGPIVPDDANIQPDDLAYVKSGEFLNVCHGLTSSWEAASPPSDESSGDDIRSNAGASDSSGTTVEVDPHEPSRVEQHLYYAGIRGSKGCGPKLVWRDSPDRFDKPSGPREERRLMRVLPVQDEHVLGELVSKGVNRWDFVRKDIVAMLEAEGVKFSSVDFVRFTWLNKKPYEAPESDGEEESGEEPEEGSEEEEEDKEGEEKDDEVLDVDDYDKIPLITRIEDGDRVFTDPTVWVGVLPDTLTATDAFDAAKGIREYLDGLDVGRIDIAFREGTFKFLARPSLYRPLDDDDDDALKPVIGNVSTAHSLYIQGLRTPMQGTLGPYFVAGGKLYAITVRHNLFPLDRDNDEYRYTNSMKKKEVILMGDLAFTHYKSSIRSYIDNLLDSAQSLTKQVAAYKKKVEGGVDVDKSRILLGEKENQLSTTERHIRELKLFWLDVDKNWTERKNRIIGHVVWAPPISTGENPNNHTCDLCVIELNKKKFKNMLGNVLSLGMKYDKHKLNELIFARDDVPSEFKFPEHGRLGLRRLLSADEVMNPNSKDSLGDPVRRVFKDGYQTNLTIGGLGKFMSTVRKYFPSGNQESTELPVFNHEAEPGTFSKGGDSGALIVDVLGRFVSLLTGGSNKGTDGTDLTYSTLFEYVWQHVRKEFPNANLSFDNLASCLADVV